METATGASQEEGVIVLFTGNGKGKTTAALGCALRASGHGMKTLIIQFMKSMGGSGEENVCPAVLKGVEIYPFGEGFLFPGDDPEPHRKAAEEAWLFTERRAGEGNYQILILDELALALDLHLLPVARVVDFLSAVKGKYHVIITGRNAPAGLVDLADIVTEMKEVKHIYRKGVTALQGLDY